MSTPFIVVDVLHGRSGKQAAIELGKLCDKHIAAAVRAMRAAAEMAKAEVVRTVQRERPIPVDTGDYIFGWKTLRRPKGADLVNTAPHAAYIEFGTRPHWVPISVLMAWATRKARGGGVNVRRLAYGAQHAIARRGTRAHKILERASKKFPAMVRAAIRGELAGLRR